MEAGFAYEIPCRVKTAHCFCTEEHTSGDTWKDTADVDAKLPITTNESSSNAYRVSVDEREWHMGDRRGQAA